MARAEEKRKYPRLPIKLLVYIKRVVQEGTSHEESVRPVEARTKDISLGGMFIELFAPFGIGTEIELELHLPGDEENEPVTCSPILAVVKWAKLAKPFGIGVEILDVPKIYRERFAELLEQS